MSSRFAEELLRCSRRFAKDYRWLVENQQLMPRLAKNCRAIAIKP